MAVNQQYQLMDIRDGKKYWVAKLSDNKVYMTQNLDYAPGTYAVAIPAESNVYAATTTNWSAIIQSEEGYYMKNGTEKTSKAEQQSDEEAHYNIGRYYPASSSYSGNNFLCPKGWKPINMINALKAIGINIEEDKIYTNDPNTTIEGAIVDTSITKEKLLSSPLYLSLSGARNNNISYGQGFQGTYRSDSFYWESRWSSQTSYSDGSTFATYYDDSYTNSRVATLEFIIDGDIVTIAETKSIYETIPAQMRCYTDAIGLDEIEYMQDMNYDVILNTPTQLSLQLKDKRDNKKYWIAKDANGEVRMTQNLDFEISPTGTIIDHSTTESGYGNFEVQSVRQWHDRIDSNAIVYIDGGDYYLENGTEKVSTEGLAEDSEKWHYHLGSYYTSAAVKLGYLNQTTFELSNICPRGWTIPDTKYTKTAFSWNSDGSYKGNNSTAYYVGYDSAQTEYRYRVYSGWYERPNSSNPFTPILYNFGERAYYHSGNYGSNAIVRYITTTGSTSYHSSPTTEAVPVRCVAKFPLANFYDH